MLNVFDSRYTVPSRRSAAEEHIPKMYLDLKSEIQLFINANKSTLMLMFSFTTDLWSSAILDPYMSLTVHVITTEMVINKPNTFLTNILV